MVIYDNEFERKENKIETRKYEIKTQHMHQFYSKYEWLSSWLRALMVWFNIHEQETPTCMSLTSLCFLSQRNKIFGHYTEQ